MKCSWALRLALGLGLLPWSCAAELPFEADGEVGVIAAPVVGGAVAEACEFPSTVSVNAWGSCSGTLIHERVVTTAAHCIEDGRSLIHFGASRHTPGAFSVEARCEVGAEGSRGANTSRDWAYCILPEDERVQQVPVTPPLVGCEAERFLQPGLEAWVVGFGTVGAKEGGAGIKRKVRVLVNELDKVAPGTIDVGDAEQGACHGDSGGPLYVHLQDGERDWGYRVAGSTSGAGSRSCDCTCSTVYVNIDNHVREIETREGIDVTPCTDAEGNFDPSTACMQLVTGSERSFGTFPSCGAARVTWPMNSCGVLDDAAVSSAAAVPNVDAAVGAATTPGAAFQPTAGSPAIGSATFSSAATPGQALASTQTADGCSIAAVSGSYRPWLALFALFALRLRTAARRKRTVSAEA